MEWRRILIGSVVGIVAVFFAIHLLIFPLLSMASTVEQCELMPAEYSCCGHKYDRAVNERFAGFFELLDDLDGEPSLVPNCSCRALLQQGAAIENGRCTIVEAYEPQEMYVSCDAETDTVRFLVRHPAVRDPYPDTLLMTISSSEDSMQRELDWSQYDGTTTPDYLSEILEPLNDGEHSYDLESGETYKVNLSIGTTTLFSGTCTAQNMAPNRQ